MKILSRSSFLNEYHLNSTLQNVINTNEEKQINGISDDHNINNSLYKSDYYIYEINI